MRTSTPITTPTTRQLESAAAATIRRRPDLLHLATTVREGDEEALLELLRFSRLGDADAALLAVWGLLPRVCAVVRTRVPAAAWRRATDDLVSITYLVVSDCTADEPALHLHDRLVSRARRRWERTMTMECKSLLASVSTFTEEPATRADHVERRAIARAELVQLLEQADQRDPVRRDLVRAVQAIEDDRTLTGPERMALMRSRRRLRSQLDRSAA